MQIDRLGQMFFQYTLQAVLTGRKTQTRRVVKQGDAAVYDVDGGIQAIKQNGRTKYRMGGSYAVQPARSAPAVARIKLLQIRQELVTEISEADAIAEGYDSREAFLESWQAIHGKNSLRVRVWALTFHLVAE